MGKTAWESYLTGCSPYNEIFGILRSEYLYSVINIDSTDQKTNFFDCDYRIAEHLMILYWRGKIAFDEKDEILEKFFEKSQDELRGHALDFIGRSLDNAEKIETEVIDRLKLLWQRRLKFAKKNLKNHKKEMAAFGYWFQSAKFEDEWSIKQLEEALEISGSSDLSYSLIKRLLELSPVHPYDVLICLKIMIANEEDGYRNIGWNDDMKKILFATSKNPDQKIKELAKEIINKLVASGFIDYRELLDD